MYNDTITVLDQLLVTTTLTTNILKMVCNFNTLCNYFTIYSRDCACA